MSQILTPGERQGAWGTIGDHDRRIRALEANLTCCVPDIGPSVSDLILANSCLSAFWKLNESSGTVAADSSGNGFDLTSSGLIAPTWGNASIVSPDTSAGFVTQGSPPPQGLARTSFPNLASADFTALIFGRRNGTNFDALIGQGTGVYSGGNGWGLGIEAFNAGLHNRLTVFKDVSNPLEASVTWLNGETHMGAVVFQVATNTWTLYQDGVDVGSEVDSFTGHTGIWLGAADPSATTEQMDGDLAYGAIFTRALAPGELANFWALFSTGGSSSGYVWTADGAGGASWQLPTIQVEFS